MSSARAPRDTEALDRVDLLVVGGGIVGTWCAFRASEEHPEWRIVLAERSMVGGGTTRFSLGFSLPLGRNACQRKQAAESIVAYQTLSRNAKDLAGRTVAIQFVVRSSGLEPLRRMILGDGETLDTHARERLVESLPGLHLEPDEVVLGGLTGWYCHPPEAVASYLAQRLEAHPGAAVWEGANVIELASKSDSVRVEVADGRRMVAGHVIVAAGPLVLSGPMAVAAHAKGLRVKKIVALHLGRCPTPRDPVLFFPADDAFLLPVIERGQWILSYTSSVWDCPTNPWELDVTDEDRAAGLRVLRRHWPSLAADYVGARASCDSYSNDWTPTAESVDGSERIVLTSACSGSGWRLAPAIASAALECVSQIGH